MEERGTCSSSARITPGRFGVEESFVTWMEGSWVSSESRKSFKDPALLDMICLNAKGRDKTWLWLPEACAGGRRVVSEG